MISVHFFAPSCNPERGGMEETAQRLLQLVSPDPELQLTTYLFAARHDPEIPPELSATVNIGAFVDKMLSPLNRNKPSKQEVREVLAEWTRLQVLGARTAVRREMDLHPDDTHVILSFYLTMIRFVGQHVASALDSPHRFRSRSRYVFAGEPRGQPAARAYSTFCTCSPRVRITIGFIENLSAFTAW